MGVSRRHGDWSFETVGKQGKQSRYHSDLRQDLDLGAKLGRQVDQEQPLALVKK